MVRLPVFAASMLLASSAIATPISHYFVTDLGVASGINNNGQVIGGNVLWDPVDGITTLPGEALDINNFGRVLGDGWVWDPILGVAILPAELRQPSAMNDLGQIVGRPLLGAGINGGYLWDPLFGITPIVNPTLGGMYPTGSSADFVMRDVNNLGRAAGVAVTGEPIPTYWDPGLPAADFLRGAVPSAGSARAVNELGQIAGVALEPDRLAAPRDGCDSYFCAKATVWDADLSPYVITAGEAYDLNDFGWVVGGDYVPTSHHTSAFLWHRDVGLFDLSSLVSTADPFYGTTFAYANGINNSGWILADDRYLLRPVSVPEPSSLTLMVFGTLLVFALRRIGNSNGARSPFSPRARHLVIHREHRARQADFFTIRYPLSAPSLLQAAAHPSRAD